MTRREAQLLWAGLVMGFMVGAVTGVITLARRIRPAPPVSKKFLQPGRLPHGVRLVRAASCSWYD